MALTAFSMVAPMVKTPCCLSRMAGESPMWAMICSPISSVPMFA